jgi:hypothetical protein
MFPTNMRVMSRFAAASVAIALLCASPAGAADRELERTGGPFVPTPQLVVSEMLRMGKVGPKDFVVDLGSGDGVIVLTAAREHKASGYGVDIDPELVKKSNAEAVRLGVAERASFHVQDVFKADLSKASVITLYLLPSMMVNLRSKIFLEPRPGTRVVSHDYNFDEWKPDDYVILDVPEKEKINGIPKATIMLWIVPAKVGGTWHVRTEAGEHYEVMLRQQYQVLSGNANAQGKPLKVSAAGLRGEDIYFTVGEGSARRHFKGAVSGEAMQGTVELGGGRTARWNAKRG